MQPHFSSHLQSSHILTEGDKVFIQITEHVICDACIVNLVILSIFITPQAKYNFSNVIRFAHLISTNKDQSITKVAHAKITVYSQSYRIHSFFQITRRLLISSQNLCGIGAGERSDAIRLIMLGNTERKYDL
jgi:hypothetical protein